MSDSGNEFAPSTSRTTTEPSSVESDNESQNEHIHAIMDLQDAEMPFAVWGSWATKIEQRDDEYAPSDVDVQLLESDAEQWSDYLSSHGYSIHPINPDTPKWITANRGNTRLDIHLVHNDGNFFVETFKEHAFYFPKQGYKEVDFGGRNVSVMGPEIMLLLEKSGPNRQGKQERIAQLQAMVDEFKFEEVSKLFRFERIQPKAVRRSSIFTNIVSSALSEIRLPRKRTRKDIS